MKRIFAIAIIGLLLIGCKQEKGTDYTINGSAKGVHNGLRVYLKNVDASGQQVISDTTMVMNEKFSLKGSVESPTVKFLSIDNIEGQLLFMLENSKIDIDINKDMILDSKVTGSKTHNDLLAFQEGMKQFHEENRPLVTIYRKAINTGDTVMKDSIRNLLEQIGQRFLKYPATFVKEHNDSYFSLNLIGLEANKQKFDVKGFLEAYESLTPRLKESEKGRDIKKKLDLLNAEYEKTAHLEIGKVAPNFEAPTPSGELVNLNDLKGKVTIIDFWAAWCGPCRKENPNVVRIYNQYHDQGLEIIGVSLDGQSRQNDPKKAWLEAIEKDNLTWHQVSNLKYFNDPVAQLYNISSIPATYILDSKGKIVAKNLRGKALEIKVQELLNK